MDATEYASYYHFADAGKTDQLHLLHYPPANRKQSLYLLIPLQRPLDLGNSILSLPTNKNISLPMSLQFKLKTYPTVSGILAQENSFLFLPESHPACY